MISAFNDYLVLTDCGLIIGYDESSTLDEFNLKSENCSNIQCPLFYKYFLKQFKNSKIQLIDLGRVIRNYYRPRTGKSLNWVTVVKNILKNESYSVPTPVSTDFTSEQNLKCLREHFNDIVELQSLFVYFLQVETQELLKCPGEKTVKVTLKSVWTDNNILVNEISINHHRIKQRALLLLQGFCMNSFDHQELNPVEWNKESVQQLLWTIGYLSPLAHQRFKNEENIEGSEILKWVTEIVQSTPGKKHNDLKIQLGCFYIQHLLPVDMEIPNVKYSDMYRTLSYTATEIVTMYQNNISSHFIEYLEKTWELFFNLNGQLKIIKNNAVKKVEKDQLQKLSNNILKEILEGRGSDIDFTEIWQNPSDEHQNFITFVKNFKPDSKGLKYQLKVKPLELLPEAFVLNKLIENNPSCNEIPPKMYRMFPQSTSLIPDHLRLDTMAMINIFKPQVQGYNLTHLSENINLFKNQIWSHYLNLDHKYLNTFKRCIHLVTR
ncbi:hypothetical protein GEMRC1_004436 [Eukaryota sp. GEM-RC1]